MTGVQTCALPISSSAATRPLFVGRAAPLLRLGPCSSAFAPRPLRFRLRRPFLRFRSFPCASPPLRRLSSPPRVGAAPLRLKELILCSKLREIDVRRLMRRDDFNGYSRNACSEGAGLDMAAQKHACGSTQESISRRLLHKFLVKRNTASETPMSRSPTASKAMNRSMLLASKS